MHLKCLLLASVLSAAPSVSGAEPGPTSVTQGVSERITDWIGPLRDAAQLSGVLLVARGDTILFRRAYGRANFELDVPVDFRTRFNVASLTKPMTVIIAAALHEAGKLPLDRPVSHWIDDFPRGDEITVAHLLHHRSGLPHRVTGPPEECQPLSTEEMVAKIRDAELLFEPGSQEAYSSAGYTLLAYILELTSGEDYAALLRTYVAEPARAIDTVHPDGAELMPNRADSYFRGAGGPINANLKHLQYLVGAGSVYSTADDVFRIQRLIVKGGYGELVRDNLVDEYGIRWNGITNGYRTFADYRPDTDITVIYASNYFTGAGDQLRRSVHKLVAGVGVDSAQVPDMTPVEVSDAARARLTGTYQLRPGLEQPLEFTGRIARLGDWVLIPTAEDRFISPQDYAEVTVARDSMGRVKALQWGGGPTFPRGSTSD